MVPFIWESKNVNELSPAKNLICHFRFIKITSDNFYFNITAPTFTDFLPRLHLEFQAQKSERKLYFCALSNVCWAAITHNSCGRRPKTFRFLKKTHKFYFFFLRLIVFKNFKSAHFTYTYTSVFGIGFLKIFIVKTAINSLRMFQMFKKLNKKRFNASGNSNLNWCIYCPSLLDVHKCSYSMKY